MGESSIYGSGSDEGRRFIEESGKEMDEPMEQENDDDKKTARLDRCGQRAERRVACRCGARSRSRRRGRRRIVSQNPFIIFYLEMYFKSPGKRVAEVARQAGKEWCAMSDEDRQKYIRLAERERRRRGGRRGTRRRRR